MSCTEGRFQPLPTALRQKKWPEEDQNNDIAKTLNLKKQRRSKHLPCYSNCNRTQTPHSSRKDIVKANKQFFATIETYDIHNLP
jgi:hypothetical protein